MLQFNVDHSVESAGSFDEGSGHEDAIKDVVGDLVPQSSVQRRFPLLTADLGEVDNLVENFAFRLIEEFVLK